MPDAAIITPIPDAMLAAASRAMMPLRHDAMPEHALCLMLMPMPLMVATPLICRRERAHAFSAARGRRADTPRAKAFYRARARRHATRSNAYR
jgi:hypothetical protein